MLTVTHAALWRGVTGITLAAVTCLGGATQLAHCARRTTGCTQTYSTQSLRPEHKNEIFKPKEVVKEAFLTGAVPVHLNDICDTAAVVITDSLPSR